MEKGYNEWAESLKEKMRIARSFKKEIKRKKNPIQGGGTYFIKCNHYIKIGISKNISKRLADIQSHNPYELDLIYSFAGNSLERLLHKVYITKNKHVKNEWFKYDGFTDVLIRGLNDCLSAEMKKKYLKNILKGRNLKNF